MSARLLGMVFEFYPTGGGEFALALALADRADEFGGNIRPGVPTLARHARLSEKQTSRLLQKLVGEGWLLMVKEAHGRGAGSFTEFKINPQWIDSCGGRPITEDRSDKMTGQNDRTKCPLKPKTASKKSSAECTILPPLISPPKVEIAAANDRKFCEFFLLEIRKLNAEHPEPRNWERWEREVRLMRERDGRSLREMAEMMRWVSADNFWCAQILSPGKLRVKWDALQARRALQKRSQFAVATGAGMQAVDHRCACGCGKPGVKSFRTDGSEWWATECHQREALRREGVEA